jgi:hypothetical protein
VIDLDADLVNADWTKQTWDIPAKNVEELRAFLRQHRMSVKAFKRKPAYLAVKDRPGFAWLREL